MLKAQIGIRRNRSHLVAACATALIAPSALADGPQATLFYAIDGGLPVTILSNGVTSNPSGNQVYAGTWNSGDGTWNIMCSVSADFNVNPVSTLSGLVMIQNTSAATHTFEFGIDVPLCPSIDGSSLVGGTTLLTLNAVGGGAVSCFNNISGVRAMADGVAIGEMFTCPFAMGASGSGTATSSASFGTPVPSMNGPGTIDAIGQREQFTLTAGDKVTITFGFNFTNTSIENTCPFDLDHDGLIDANDLGLLLSNWGETSYCGQTLVGDLNQDGIVAGADITWMLRDWGPCEN